MSNVDTIGLFADEDGVHEVVKKEEWEQAFYPEKASDGQVGGDHYLKMKFKPYEIGYYNNLGALETTVIKYVMRHESKNGLEDINKAIHCLELIKEYHYGCGTTNE